MSCDDRLDPEQLARTSEDFVRREIELGPAQELSSSLAAWRDAVVFLTEGEIELVCVAGERRRFTRGSVLCFAPTVRGLRNCGAQRARLIAIARRPERLPHSG
jgi:hypothetical protein